MITCSREERMNNRELWSTGTLGISSMIADLIHLEAEDWPQDGCGGWQREAAYSLDALT